jgi:uncharacterized membrane protein YagU involved in acid resistance
MSRRNLVVSAEATPGTVSLYSRAMAGAVAGAAAGIPLGIIMQARDMIPMVGDLIGQASTGWGWLVHLFKSALFGVIFAALFARWFAKPAVTVGLGLLYGLAWWVLGALIIMPAWLGMSEMILVVNDNAWWSLLGHLIYGLILALGIMTLRSMMQRR